VTELRPLRPVRPRAGDGALREGAA